jgi:glucans biosynthesis protein
MVENRLKQKSVVYSGKKRRCTASAATFNRQCRNPAMKGSAVCVVHAGLAKPGAPRGNKNAQKHGQYSQRALQEEKAAREYAREMERLLDDLVG